jgi:photosystem II stability/assembly factor-like uncharacterized protein
MISEDYGLSWSGVAIGVKNWWSLAFGNGVLNACGKQTNQQLMRSLDYGKTWSISSGGLTTEALTTIKYAEGVWLAIASSGTYKLIKSTDNGLNWNLINLGSFTPTSLEYNSEEKYWLIGGNSTTYLKSLDNGVTWITITSSTNSNYLLHTGSQFLNYNNNDKKLYKYVPSYTFKNSLNYVKPIRKFAK